MGISASPSNSAKKRRRPRTALAQLELKTESDTRSSPRSSPSSATTASLPSPSSFSTPPLSPRDEAILLTRRNTFRFGWGAFGCVATALIGAKLSSFANVEQSGELTPLHRGDGEHASIEIPPRVTTGRVLLRTGEDEPHRQVPKAVQLSTTSGSYLKYVSSLELLGDVFAPRVSSLPSPPSTKAKVVGIDMDIQNGNKCRPMAGWQVEHHPSCLMFHETNLQPSIFNSAQVLASGYYRTVWRINDGAGEKVAIKTLRFPSEERQGKEIAKLQGYGVGFHETVIEQQRTDAIIISRLQKSDHVARMYGYCSTSAMVEFADGGNLRDMVRKGKLTKEMKLELAINATEAVADVHNYNAVGYATIAHTDLNPKQFLLTGGKQLRLNDFNRGILLSWNEEKAEPCPINSGIAWRARYQSPEEHLHSVQSEKIDVFTLGLVLWVILTGRTTPYKGMDQSERRDFVTSGKTLFNVSSPALELASEDPFEAAIAFAISKCWTMSPQERPSARDILYILRNAHDAEHNKA